MRSRKPVEELYDLQNDPDEVNDLAGWTRRVAAPAEYAAGEAAKKDASATVKRVAPAAAPADGEPAVPDPAPGVDKAAAAPPRKARQIARLNE